MTAPAVRRILIIEDGNEYERFARLFLTDGFHIRAAHSAVEALRLLSMEEADGFLLDLRFDRSDEKDLAGDIDAVAKRLFASDRAEAVKYLKEHQGTLILKELRSKNCNARAIFIHDFPIKRLENLRRLYGDVAAFPSFDAANIRAAFGVSP
jgi:ActR/RegA family two-component response regulator